MVAEVIPVNKECSNQMRSITRDKLCSVFGLSMTGQYFLVIIFCWFLHWILLKATELAHSFSFCSCVCFCRYGPFNCTSFHKFFRQLCFSLCSSGLISALLVLSTVYLFVKVFLSPDIILCDWLGLKHLLTNCFGWLNLFLLVKNVKGMSVNAIHRQWLFSLVFSVLCFDFSSFDLFKITRLQAHFLTDCSRSVMYAYFYE